VPEEPLLEPYLQRTDIFVKRVADDTPLPFTPSFRARHQLANARLAAAVAECLDVPPPETLTVEFSKLREEERPLPGGGLLLNHCYNANPVSMRAALGYLAERAGGRRRLAVLGEMAELGRTAPAYHREVGEAAAELGVDELAAVGELARGYLEGGVPGRWVANVHEAVRELDELVRPGDAVLVKASRAVGLEAVAAALTRVPTA